MTLDLAGNSPEAKFLEAVMYGLYATVLYTHLHNNTADVVHREIQTIAR